MSISWTQQTKLTASDAAATNYFGNASAIDGDYAIVGAVGNDNNSKTDNGAAYIFKKDDGAETWTEKVKIVPDDTDGNYYFGSSVAIKGDYVIVGARGATSNTGAAYIFKKDDGAETWTQKAKLIASDGATSDQFGWAVSFYNDYAIVTSKNDHHGDPELSDAGSAYIFKKDSGAETWTQQAKLTASDAAGNDQFGTSVSMYEDYVVIGAMKDHHGTPEIADAGSAYIFKKDSGAETWTQTAKLTASDAGDQNRFGSSCAIYIDYVVVGADYCKVGDNAGQGAAYIFKKDDGAETWTQKAKLTGSDGEAQDRFGGSATIFNNYIIIGHIVKNKAYVFKKDTGAETWTQQEKITPSDSNSGDRSSGSVALNGNYLISGASRHDHGDPEISDAGSAYIFKLSGDDNGPNIPPTGLNKTISSVEDTTYTFGVNDISGNDANGDTITKFKITALPSKGTFEVSGNTITLNQNILAADVTNMTYLPVSGETGNSYVTINYQPYDGESYSDADYTIIFNITEDTVKLEALNSGLSSSNTDKIKNTTISQNGAETNVFADKFIKNVSQRHSALKLLFSKNASITKTKINRKELKLTPNIRKEKVMVHKPKTTATIAAAAALVVNDEVDADTGIYANLADVGDAIKFKAHSGATDVVFTKTATGYTASTSGDTVWQPGDRYTFENVSYYFD